MNRDISFHAQWLALLKSHAIFFSQSKAKVKLVDFPYVLEVGLEGTRVWDSYEDISFDTVLNLGKPFRFCSDQLITSPTMVFFILLCFIVSQQAARSCASRGDGPSRFTAIMEINHRRKDRLTCKAKWLMIDFYWSLMERLKWPFLGAISRLHFAVLWQLLNPVIQ